MARAKKHRGSCLCGGVRFTITGPFEDAYFCHCQQCRKNFGMHGAFGGMLRDALVIEASQPLTSYKSSRDVTRTFCGRCGSPITWDRKGDDKIYISLGLLDGKIALPKIENIHAKDKGDYYEIG